MAPGNEGGFFDSYYMSADDAKKTLLSQHESLSSPPQEAPVPEPPVEESAPVTANEPESSVDNTDNVRNVYMKWCEVFGKEMTDDRFRIFSTNFLAMESYAAKTGTVMQFHKWYDFTEEEYTAMTADGKEVVTETKTLEEILEANVDLLDAAAAAQDEQEWDALQEKMSSTAAERLKEIAGKLTNGTIF